MTQTPQWLAWVQRLQAISQIGITYAQIPYDRERYQDIREIAIEIAAAHTSASPDHIRNLFIQERGYATPKVDVRGVVFQDQRILLVREVSDGLWTLPGGWADPGDSPSFAVEREIREESGYEARAIKLLAAYDRAQQGHPPYEYAVYKLFFLCQLTGGSSQTSIETSEVGFFAEDEIPPLSLPRVLPHQIKRFYEHLRQPDLPTDFN